MHITIKRRGPLLLKAASFLFLAILLILIIPAHSQGSDNYIKELQELAIKKNLHEARYWEVLLHYKPGRFGIGTKSLVDDKDFFLAQDGKTNPKAELLATIEGFFGSNTTDNAHPQCRFIARYSWLKKELAIDIKRLPRAECLEYKAALKNVNPKTATLIFPAAHINAPASMFGHTLVRFDSDKKKSKLLSYAANYSAEVTDTNGLLYAVKGLAGGYQGFFTILPYYQKVTEYSDMDQRDMWEYRLSFSEEEVMRMLMHLWELKDIFSYYYFFDENCSYTLLFLFEAARPDIALTERFSGSAIPIDTIRALEDGGVIGSAVYRPSLGTKIKYIAGLLSDDERAFALDVSMEKIPPSYISKTSFNDETKATILDLAAEHLQYRYSKEEILKTAYKKLFLATLKERGTLAIKADYKIPTPFDPLGGHLTRRLALGTGMKDGSHFQEVKYRPAYHELLDPDDGFVKGSQIEFFDFALRHYPADDRVEVESIDIINILSLTPRDEFFKPLSWKFDTGFSQRLFPSNERKKRDHLVYHLNPGAGYTFKNPLGIHYALAEGEFIFSGRFRDSYNFGVGGVVGTLLQPHKNWRLDLSVRAMYFDTQLAPDAERHREYTASLKQSFVLSRNNMIRLDLKREKVFNIYQTDGVLSWNLFF